MSVTSYFTNLNKAPDCQEIFSCDFREKIHDPEWSNFRFDATSEDSNNSTNTSNSSTSSMRTDLSDIKPLTVNNSSASCQSFLLQTPEKTLKCCSQAAEKRVTPRKPLKPTKSANKSDPSFRGVTLQMKTSVKRSRHDMETQLVIRSYFTAKKSRPSAEKQRSRTPVANSRLLPASLELRFQQTSESDSCVYDVDELKENCGDLGCRPFRHTAIRVEKECASCGTVKTPLWRDAEDGTPLCNACGIRYKKYRIRCSRCWYIPKKEEKTQPHCTGCGIFIKVPVGRRGSIFADL